MWMNVWMCERIIINLAVSFVIKNKYRLLGVGHDEIIIW
jgi:hypothetical protein